MSSGGCKLMRELTKRQKQVLGFIQQAVRRTGRAPTYRAMASHLGVDVRSAYQHVQSLERKGVLERSGGRIDLASDYQSPKGLPVLGRVAAGTPILAVENIEGYIDLDTLLNEENLFYLRIKGDSMIEAGIHDGDLVMARAQSTVENGEIAVVVVGEESTVKHVRFLSDRLILEPANPKYEPMTLYSGDDVRIAGKVLMAMRWL